MQVIAGKFKNQKLLTPKGLDTRPTASRLRETLFNICQTFIENARFLDLFAGSGAMGLEALSRGASWATFIEKSPNAIKIIKQNIKNLDVENQTSILCGDCAQLLPRAASTKIPYDIIYLDPPYENWDHEILHFIDTSDLLISGGYLFIEEAKKPEYLFENLVLVSERSAGRSKLFQYKKN